MLPQKAIIWQEQDTLLLADIHLGKVTHFRKAGISIPIEAAQENIRVLKGMVESFANLSRIIILGDLFHSIHNEEWVIFTDWVRSNNIPVTLVLGNHDILAKRHYAEAGIATVKEPYLVDNFLLSHYPMEKSAIPEGKFNLAGHLHPSVALYGNARQRYVLPCFWIRPNQCILPAFGSFTGSCLIKAEPMDKIYTVLKTKVCKIE